MAVTPDNSHIFIADLANHAFIVAVRGANGQYALGSLETPITDAANVVIVPDGTRAYVLGGGSPNTITVIDVATLQAEPVSVLQPYVNLQELVPSPDGRRFYAPDRSAGALRVLDPSSLRILQTLPLARDISQAQGAAGAAIAPDGSRTMSVLQQISM
jgi:DNA-binding beta-propeller fold protein YncE